VRVIWSETAKTRLLQIHDFVAEANPVAAERLTDRLLARADSLSAFPMRGRPGREAAGGSVRELLNGNYRIIHRVRGRIVEIVTVFEAHRLFPREDLQ
jgi:toxin ParE1/3/4